MNAYNEFGLTHSGLICYVNPSCPMLSARKEHHGLTQQVAQHDTATRLLPPNPPSQWDGEEWNKNRRLR